jgi:hypothetical protein
MGEAPRAKVEWTWVLRPADQVTSLAILAIGWLFLLVQVHRNGLTELPETPILADPRQNNESSSQALVAYEVDVNRSEWPEWALLPGVGETLAKRIVEHRTRVGGFTTVDEVGRVRGIGPQTLARLRPYLIRRSEFPSPPPTYPAKRSPWNSNSPVNSVPRAINLKRSPRSPRR